MGHQPEPENRHPKKHGIHAFKNPKHDKRASWVGDGSNTVRDIEVHHTAILKSWKPKKHVKAIFQKPLFGHFSATFDPF
jgi:hypothetical protein